MMGENGILGKATDSVAATRKGAAEEQVYLAWTSAQTKYYGDKANGSGLVPDAYFSSDELSRYVSQGEIVNVRYKMNAQGDSQVIYKDTSVKTPTYYTVTIKGTGQVVSNDATTDQPPIPSVDNIEEITLANNASRNSQDTIGMIQTAEGALNEVHDMLQRMLELSIQVANGVDIAEQDRVAINTEYQALINEINYVSSTVQFNQINLLDGTLIGSNSWKTQLAKRILRTEVDHTDATTLGLANTDTLTQSNAIQAIDKISAAVNQVGNTRAKLGAKQNQLEHIICYYDSLSETLSAYSDVDEVKDQMVISSASEILSMLRRMKELTDIVVGQTMTANEKNCILVEVLELKNAINIIAEDTSYKGGNVLDGTYKDIPNLNCIGLGENGLELYTDYTTDADAIKTQTQCANAIAKVEEVLGKYN